MEFVVQLGAAPISAERGEISPVEGLQRLNETDQAQPEYFGTSDVAGRPASIRCPAWSAGEVCHGQEVEEVREAGGRRAGSSV
jgi:glycyl-tRNA synthetase (class II)